MPGDGIGPEIIAEAVALLDTLGNLFNLKLEFAEGDIGGCAIDKVGVPLPAETVNLCLNSDAVLLGAVGGPKWDRGTGSARPEAGLLGIRKALGVFANIRPIRVFKELAAASPLKPSIIKAADFVIVRELTGGLYFGEPKERRKGPQGESVVDTLHYTRAEMERIIRVGFKTAAKRGGRLTSVDKANVLESSRLWREVAEQVKGDYPNVELSHLLVDNCAMQIVKSPGQFDVIVTENLFGDILSDEAAVITGSIGLLPSASLGENGMGLYEPIHGSAPDIAGQGLANPLATFLSVAMMLRYSFQNESAAKVVEDAVAAVLKAGLRTRDLVGPLEGHLSTREMSQEVQLEIKRRYDVDNETSYTV